MKAEEIEFELESICPILMDKWVDAEKEPKSDKEYRQLAEKKVYTDEKGNIGIPTSAIKAVIRESAPMLGKKMQGKKLRQDIKSGVFFDKEILQTGHKKHDGIIRHIVTRKGTGDKVTRVPTYRPILKEWKCKGRMILYGVASEFVKQALELGGMRFALLGYRPEFGRFQLKRWSVIA